MIVVTKHRPEALARLDVFVGEWVIEARFPSDYPAAANAKEEGPQARSWFEWALERAVPGAAHRGSDPRAPDSLTIVSVDPETGAYIQHYYHSRGVARLYAMSLTGGLWTLTRESPDFTPLDFRQRFTGTFSDGNIISGAWEKGLGGAGWEHDFALAYRQAS